MRIDRRVVWSAALATAALAAAGDAAAQERGMLSREARPQPAAPAPPGGPPTAAHNPNAVHNCRGPVARVTDVAFEGVKTTSHNWSNATGGGDSRRYDSIPVLSTAVSLAAGTCLDAHLSALVGSRQTYGSNVASITMFQVSLTPVAGGIPRHMVGHFDTPYGRYGPAVAIEAERDVDMLAANFFQRAGTERGDVPPGNYRVDVWWSGGPVGGGGAIGADFVLKLYSR